MTLREAFCMASGFVLGQLVIIAIINLSMWKDQLDEDRRLAAEYRKSRTNYEAN